MSVHMIRGFIAPDSGMTETQVQDAIDTWVSARTKWQGNEGDDAVVSRRNTAEDGTGADYLAFTVRFTWDSDTKDNMLQKCGDKFKTKVAWFSLAWHECHHDGAGQCSWDERRDWDDGNGIPAAVQDRLPDASTVVAA